MHLTLKILSGGNAGQTVLLQPAQRLSIGRTNVCDLMFADDGRMSSRHFAIESDGDAWRIVDLKSTNHTFVNGERIETAPLNDGDMITAGQTTFSIQIVGPAPGPTAPPPAEPIVASLDVCASGLARWQGEFDEQTTIARLAQALSTLGPMHLILDLTKLQWQLPDHVKPAYLFDWLPEPACAGFSPVLLSPSDPANLVKVVEKSWGKDAMVCLFSPQQKPDLLKHLQAVSRGKESPAIEPPAGRVSGFCWPRICEQLLVNRSPMATRFMLTDIVAVLLEGESPKAWQLFGERSLDDRLIELGVSPRELQTYDAPS